MERWSGRPALVTGASVGIGAGIARALVKAGMKVAVCARNLEQLQALKEELKDQPGTVLPIQCDVQDEKQIMAMFDVIKKELGGVDVCVNNAGLAKNAPLLTGSTADWKNMMDAISPGNVATEFLQRLYESNKEKIHTPNHAIKFLEVQDIAAAAIYALSAPPHAEVHDILIRPVEMKH